MIVLVVSGLLPEFICFQGSWLPYKWKVVWTYDASSEYVLPLWSGRV